MKHSNKVLARTAMNSLPSSDTHSRRQSCAAAEICARFHIGTVPCLSPRISWRCSRAWGKMHVRITGPGPLRRGGRHGQLRGVGEQDHAWLDSDSELNLIGEQAHRPPRVPRRRAPKSAPPLLGALRAWTKHKQIRGSSLDEADSRKQLGRSRFEEAAWTKQLRRSPDALVWS